MTSHLEHLPRAADDAAPARAVRSRAWFWVRVLLLCWVWCALGLFLLGWSVHTTSHYYGTIAFWAGLGLGEGGILFTLVAAWRRHGSL